MIGRQYAISEKMTVATGPVTLWQITAAAASRPLWINYIAVDGSSDTSDGMDIDLLRKSVTATGLTAFTTTATGNPLLATAGTVQQSGIQTGGGNTSGFLATGEGTNGASLWRRQASVQSGGGVAEWFPEGAILVPPGGIIALRSVITITSASVSVSVIFSEIG